MIFVHKFISDLTGEIPASIRVKRLGSVCLSGVVSESNRKWSMGKRMVTWPMASCDRERSSRDPNTHTIR